MQFIRHCPSIFSIWRREGNAEKLGLLFPLSPFLPPLRTSNVFTFRNYAATAATGGNGGVLIAAKHAIENAEEGNEKLGGIYYFLLWFRALFSFNYRYMFTLMSWRYTYVRTISHFRSTNLAYSMAMSCPIFGQLILLGMVSMTANLLGVPDFH